MKAFIFRHAYFFFAGIMACTAPLAASNEEELFVRRIIEFWKDQDFPFVKSQILQFQKQYPCSSYQDSLTAILGDLYWQEREYQTAMETYAQIKDPEWVNKTFSHRLDCLYHLERFNQLEMLLKNKISGENPLCLFYYAESLFNLAKQSEDLNRVKPLLKQALELYATLNGTPHELNSQLARAEIYSLLKDSQQAADIFFYLAEHHPQRKEEFLFNAAILQSQFNLIRAVDTYQQIIAMNGKRSPEAAILRAYALHDLGLFEQLIKESVDLEALVTKNQKPQLKFLLGFAEYRIGRYENAVEQLTPLLLESELKHEKNIRLALISCAYHLKNLTDLKNQAIQYERLYPNDASLPTIWYFQALSLKEAGELAEALNSFSQIHASDFDFDKREEVELERIQLLHRLSRWEDCREAALAFIEKFPESDLLAAVYPFIPTSTLRLLNRQDTFCATLREQLVDDLHLVMKVSEVFSNEQIAKHQALLGKTLYELKRYPEAIAVARQWIEKFPKDPLAYQTHLLLAACYYEGLADIKSFTMQTEQAFKLMPHHPDNGRLHLNLFSLYIQNDGRKAAEHLYAAMQSENITLTKDQLLWLANFYYDQVHVSGSEWIIEPLRDYRMVKWANHAINAYEKVMSQHDQLDALELFKLSNLYGCLNQLSTQIELLIQLIKQPTENPRLVSRAFFSLARAYERLGFSEEALSLYLFLASSSGATQDPFILNASKLHWSRLFFAGLTVEEKQPESLEIKQGLNFLKEVQIAKNLSYEPIHLEAALDYSFLQGEMAPQGKRSEHYLLQLVKFKEDFTSQEDIPSKDYHAQRMLKPEKDVTYQAYIKLMEAEIARLEGELGKKRSKTEAARSIYLELIKGKFAVSEYLVRKAQTGLQIIKEAGYD